MKKKIEVLKRKKEILLLKQKKKEFFERQNGEYKKQETEYEIEMSKEARVDGNPKPTHIIKEKSTGKIVGELEGNNFKNYGMPNATWNGRELKVGDKVLIKRMVSSY